ncbi:MAG: hypothetical protein AB9907_07075 [Flexilinea sp.]
MDRKKRHDKQVRQQIILPAILIILFFFLCAGLLIYFNQKDPFIAQKLSDFSIILILVLAILFNLVVIFILIGAIRKTAEWNKKLPNLTEIPQEKIASIKPVIDDILNKAAEPVIATRSWGTAFKNIFHHKDVSKK